MQAQTDAKQHKSMRINSNDSSMYAMCAQVSFLLNKAESYGVWGNFNTPDDSGMTCLRLAVQTGTRQVALALIQCAPAQARGTHHVSKRATDSGIPVATRNAVSHSTSFSKRAVARTQS